jgi:hypothetical protein
MLDLSINEIMVTKFPKTSDVSAKCISPTRHTVSVQCLRIERTKPKIQVTPSVLKYKMF